MDDLKARLRGFLDAPEAKTFTMVKAENGTILLNTWTTDLRQERYANALRITTLEAENASLKAQLATVEAETLERAAKMVDDWPDNAISKQAVWRIAAAIRALKNKDTDHDAG